MGLAEPRKRLKISHDPNNLTWSQSAESYGHKLLSSQGWKPGQGLGASNAKNFNSPLVPKVAISYKDDTLGVGASLKSQDPIHTRTGLDAFQGLLGRLNGKTDVELKEEARKNENRTLALWAKGRWGGIMFVPGGKLVQGDGYKTAEEGMQKENNTQETSEHQIEGAEGTEKAQRKAERKKRKEEKRIKREAKFVDKQTLTGNSYSKTVTETMVPTDGPLTESPKGDIIAIQGKKKKKRERPNLSVAKESHARATEEKAPQSISPAQVPSESPVIVSRIGTLPRTGRHIIRGRNIEAKKMAFSNPKMLDEIFMDRIPSQMTV